MSGTTASTRAIIFAQPEKTVVPYKRPDLCLYASIRAASDQIRAELKTLGEEESYATSLRVIKAQSELAASLAGQLLARLDGEE